MAGLSEASVAAIADLGNSGVDFDKDARPALVAVGITPRHEPTQVSGLGVFVPGRSSHIRRSLADLDLTDPDVVTRVLRFAARIAEVYAASSRADRARLVRLRNALADDGYTMHVGDGIDGGDVARVSINKRGIEQMAKEIQKEFDKHPIRMPVEAEARTAADTGHTTINYNGPVIQGNVEGAQLAWGNQTVNQTQEAHTEQIAPGFEAIAQAVVKTLEGLPRVGLPEEEREDAEAAANEVLEEVTASEPNRGKIRRALARLKGHLALIATGMATGAGEGAAHEWAKTAVQQLSTISY